MKLPQTTAQSDGGTNKSLGLADVWAAPQKYRPK